MRQAESHPVKRQAPILTKRAPERYTLGVVYEPDTVDAHGEWADAESIKHAA